MKALEISLRRMDNSGLLGRRFTSPFEAVQWHVAVQAQDFGPAKWSVGQRSRGLANEDVESALNSGSILRTHVLRPTWHFVARDDIRWLLRLTGPRIRQQTSGRLAELGLDAATIRKCESKIAAALRGDEHLTREEISRLLNRSGMDPSGQRLPYILMHCEIEAVICSGRMRGKKQTYALLDERAAGAKTLSPEESLTALIRRYLASHGPATVEDMRWWSGLKTSDIRIGLESLGEEVLSTVIDGAMFWSVAGGRVTRRSRGLAQLLQPYDELIVGYSESRFFGDPLRAPVQTAWRQRSLPSGIVLLNGTVAGHWKRRVESRGVKVEILHYAPERPALKRAVEAACSELGTFVGLPVKVEMSRIDPTLR